MITYTDDCTLYTTIKSLKDRLVTAKSLNLYFANIESWCNLWGMFLNPSRSTSFAISRSRTITPPHTDIIIDGHLLDTVNSFKFL